MEIMKSSNTYMQLIGTSSPGLIMILLDQSGSMSENKKAIEAAKAVNRVIYEIVLASRSGEQIKDRCSVGVIGYGASIKPVIGGKISEIANSFLRMEQIDKKVSDGAGGLIDVRMEMPVWVEPLADNGTPMAEAMTQAHKLINPWVNDRPNSFPPIVINITDGEPNDFNKNTGEAPQTQAAAKKLMQLATNDGGLLLFNAHITGTLISLGEIQLPNNERIVQDKYARLLFNISSELPPRLLQEAQKVGMTSQVGSRGLVFNATTETLIKLLIFGSSVAR